MDRCDLLGILDSLPLGAMVLRRDLTVVYWNSMLAEWTGIPRQQMLGTTITNRYPHLGQSRYTNRLAPLFDGGPSVIFSSQLHGHFLSIAGPDGIERTQHTTVTPLQVNGETHALVSIQDVTDLTRLAQNARALHNKALREIEERKKAEAQLRLSGSVFAGTSEGIFVTDTELVVLSVNPAFEKITGYSADEVLGKSPQMFLCESCDAPFCEEVLNRVQRDGMWVGEILSRHQNGATYPIEITLSGIRDENGNLVNFAAIFNDITERKNVEEHLRFLSMRDGLTGLFNRRTFDDRLVNEWRRALRAPAPFSILFLDIDCFKDYNDAYGHQRGDSCLGAVANIIGRSVHRAADLAARYGGEEFVVMLPVTATVDAFRIAEMIRRDVEELRIEHNRSKVKDVVTISVGVATIVPMHGRDSADLVSMADQSLYLAKSKGKNRVECLEC